MTLHRQPHITRREADTEPKTDLVYRLDRIRHQLDEAARKAEELIEEYDRINHHSGN